MAIDIVLLGGLVLAAMATVMTARLLRAVIWLAVTSVFVALLMFRLNANIAGVFELSVCAGLIPAIFITSIGLTQRLTPEALAVRRRERLKRFWHLPLIVILAGIALSRLHVPLEAVMAPAPAAPAAADVRNVLWALRHTDLLGQIVVLLGGVFGVAVLIMEARHEQ
jgi:NADH:ubiquinone oxidoreductase subunit 6 (subunit J)